jgi:hypothetical protein
MERVLYRNGGLGNVADAHGRLESIEEQDSNVQLDDWNTGKTNGLAFDLTHEMEDSYRRTAL